MAVPLASIKKKYPPRGPLSQFRFDETVAFVCGRCVATKKSKLISIYGNDWDIKLCNGCYGYLLKLFEIRSEKELSHEKLLRLDKLIDQISDQFCDRIGPYQKALSDGERGLTSATNRFLATARFLKTQLPKGDHLEWSPAILCLCKAVESELVDKFLNPVKSMAEQMQIQLTEFDRRTKRVEQYVLGQSDQAPELGAICFFLDLLASSDKFRQQCQLSPAIAKTSVARPFFEWYLDTKRCALPLKELVSKFRNKAAHLTELNEADFLACEALSSSILAKTTMTRLTK